MEKRLYAGFLVSRNMGSYLNFRPCSDMMKLRMKILKGERHMGSKKYETWTDYTKQLCSYIKNTGYEDIPPLVIERAKMFVLHTIGVSLCATALPQGQDVIAMAKELSAGAGSGEATLWGDGAKVSMEAAGLAAGCLGDLLDWEDCSWTGHPSCCVIPAAVIGAEAMKKSGKDLLAAVVLGYEVSQRIALAAHTNLPGYNMFSALVPYMKLADLDEESMNNCLGMGAVSGIIPANVHERTMSDSLNYQYGYRMEAAASMVRLAKDGIGGLKDAFDVPSAYVAHMESRAYAGENDPGWFVRDLGSSYLTSTILVKHWPANVFVQTYAEIVHKLMTKYPIDPDNIEEIIVDPSVRVRMWYLDPECRSATHAQFSIPYCVACAFYHPEPGAVWYEEKTIMDPKIHALMNKVRAGSFLNMFAGVKAQESLAQVIRKMIEGYHPEKFITVKMKNQEVYTEGLFQHPGHPNYMLTREEFADRFRTETKYVLSPDKAEKVIDTVFHLENCEDVSVLCDNLFNGN